MRRVAEYYADKAGVGRHGFCDGLRGWAALSVMVYHVLRAEDVLVHLYQRIVVLDGPLAVTVFFAVSGFSLRCVVGERSVLLAWAARWPRLAMPCVFHAFVGTLALHTTDAVMYVYNVAFAALYAFFPPPGGPMAVTPAFVTAMYTRGGEMSPQIWTMRYEMAGSVAIFAGTLALAHAPRPSWGAFAVATLLVFASCPKMCFFIMGAFFQSRWDLQPGRELVALVWGVGFALPALLMRGYDTWAWGGQALSLLRVAMLFECVHTSATMQRFLSTSLSTFLGRISFSLYLCHYYVIEFMGQHMAPGAARATTCVAASLALAVFSEPVDQASMRASKKFARWLVGPPSGDERGRVPCAAADEPASVAGGEGSAPSEQRV